jgi:SagB-type dehydrogenase family enzyme
MTEVQDEHAVGARDTQTWRPADDLVIEVSGENIRVSSSASTKRLRVNREALRLLLVDRTQLSPERLSSSRAVTALVEHGFLVPEDTPRAALPPPWDAWGSLLRELHARSDEVRFYHRNTERIDEWHERLQTIPRPPKTRLASLRTSGEPMFLPRTRVDSPGRSFSDVIYSRRSHRSFAAQPVALDHLSEILRAGFGPVRFQETDFFGTAQLRAPMSAGARNETSAVVVAYSVEGLEPGVYVFDEIRHALLLLQPGLMREEVESATAMQGFNEKCGFNIVVISDAAEFAWKYRNARAYRMLMNNVGAVAQVIAMTAESLSLGCATTAAISLHALASLIPLDPEREMPLISLAVGHPRRSANGLPLDHRPTVSHG